MTNEASKPVLDALNYLVSKMDILAEALDLEEGPGARRGAGEAYGIARELEIVVDMIRRRAA